MNLRVKTLNETYRGFRLGYHVSLRGYLPAWRSSLENGWHVASMYADDFGDIVRLARQCIDYRYRIEAAEAALGRELRMDELTPDL